MKKESRRGGVIGALLGEYRLAIQDLQAHLENVTDAELAVVVDRETTNKDCVSIQSILTHVVFCGRKYVTMIDIHRGNPGSPWPRRARHENVREYGDALNRMMEDTETFFEGVRESEMAQFDPAKKIKTGWGQIYDYEQLMEHAIVHVSRHRRQIQRFKAILRGEAR